MYTFFSAYVCQLVDTNSPQTTNPTTQIFTHNSRCSLTDRQCVNKHHLRHTGSQQTYIHVNYYYLSWTSCSLNHPGWFVAPPSPFSLTNQLSTLKSLNSYSAAVNMCQLKEEAACWPANHTALLPPTPSHHRHLSDFTPSLNPCPLLSSRLSFSAR